MDRLKGDRSVLLRFKTKTITSEDMETGRLVESGLNECPVCHGRFMTLADEAGGHQCPDCGFAEGGKEGE